MIQNIWKYRQLLYTLVRRDLIVRYQSSVLGFFWSFAKPLALVLIFGFAFQVILDVDTPNPNVDFAFHLIVGILVWTFFARSIAEGHSAVLAHSNLIKKVKLPVEVFPAVTVVGNLINFFLAMLVVLPIILISMSGKEGFSWGQAWVQVIAFVFLTGLTALLAFAFTLIVSALNVFYRDMESVTEVALQAWFYATPIVYPLSLLYNEQGLWRLGESWAKWIEVLYWLNPMTPICAAYRRVLLYRPVDNANQIKKMAFDGLEVSDHKLFLFLGVSVAVTGLLYLLAQAIFRRYSRHFADEV